MIGAPPLWMCLWSKWYIWIWKPTSLQRIEDWRDARCAEEMDIYDGFFNELKNLISTLSVP